MPKKVDPVENLKRFNKLVGQVKKQDIKTNKDIARYLGISERTFYNYKKGVTKIPLRLVGKLSRKVKVNLKHHYWFVVWVASQSEVGFGRKRNVNSEKASIGVIKKLQKSEEMEIHYINYWQHKGTGKDKFTFLDFLQINSVIDEMKANSIAIDALDFLKQIAEELDKKDKIKAQKIIDEYEE